MNNKFLQILKQGGNEWWSTFSTLITMSGKKRATRGKHTQDSLRDILIMYKAAVDAKCTSNWMHDFPRRVGYQIGGTSGIKCGLYSEDTLIDNNTTDDHIFGATLAGNQLLKEFKEWDYNIDYMVNHWLPDNIWLFCSATITKKEHGMLESHGHTVNQKLNFVHYEECNIKLEHRETAFRDSKKLITLTENAEVNMKLWFK